MRVAGVMGCIALGLRGEEAGRPVTLAIDPAAIAVSPSYASVQARAVLHNGLKSSLHNLELLEFTNDGLAISTGSPSTSIAKPDQAVEWRIQINDPARARLPATAQFEVKYRKGGDPTDYRVFASVTLTSQADAAPLTASLEGNFEAISEQRPGAGALVVTNGLDLPMNVKVEAAAESAGITICPIAPFTIPARSTVRRPVRIEAASRITPGAFPADFEVTGTWRWAGGTEERHVLVSKQATVGVFFESELLKALGIPSFLVLPGCLILFTMQLLLAFNILGAKNESKVPDLSVKEPSFWILSITLSIVFAPIYFLAAGHNYLVQYGALDLLLIWMSSIAIGVVLYLLIAGTVRRRRRNKVPTAVDDPITVICKMAHNGLGIVAPKARFTVNNTEWSGFVIEPIEDGKTMLWLAPGIQADWGATPGAAQVRTDHNADVNHSQDANWSERKSDIAKRIGKRLAEAQKTNPPEVQVRWDSQGNPPLVASPTHVKADAITMYEQPQRMVT